MLRKTLRLAPALMLTSAMATGCGNCEGRLEVVEGVVPVPPGASIQLEYYFDEKVVSSADDCHGFWYVNGIEGGDETVGTVTPCGLYTAPEVAPDGEIEVMAADYAAGTCADCCPYATMVVNTCRSCTSSRPMLNRSPLRRS